MSHTRVRQEVDKSQTKATQESDKSNARIRHEADRSQTRCKQEEDKRNTRGRQDGDGGQEAAHNQSISNGLFRVYSHILPEAGLGIVSPGQEVPAHAAS